ncbi:MAG: hypothetical protein R2783_09835 [Gelidibacter sp.]
MDKKKLRIGLLIDAYTIPLWAYEMVKSIQNSTHSEINLVVKNESASFTASIESKPGNWNHLLFSLYQKWDKNHFKPTPDAFEPKNLKDIISCPEIMVRPKVLESKDIFEEQDVKTIDSHSIDVLIKLGFNDLGGALLQCAKYGVWGYHHGDFETHRGNAFGSLELLENWDETRAVLLQLAENIEDSTKIHEAYYSTDHVSMSRNRNVLYYNSATMLPRKLEELYRLGEKVFFGKIKKQATEPLFYSNREFKTPTNIQVIKGLYHNWKRAIGGMISRKFYLRQWIILFQLEKSEKLSKSFHTFKRMMPPKTSFWADPFVIEKNGIYYIFIEEFVFSENKGKISVIEMDQQGNYSEPTIVIETPYHLSYPFLIEENGDLYMVPETEENRTIELYKCIEFPLKWELQETLMDNIMAADTTIYKKDNKFWLFTNVKEYNGTKIANELMLFYCDRLVGGKWTPHPQNPIAIDHHFARPAGNIFNYGERVFRPAQNCSKHYGYGMQIMEIMTLNETEYEERQIQSIYPNWEKDVKSVHTLNFSGRLTVIDATVIRRN